MAYEAIVAIVERGRANEVVRRVTDAGAHGATIAYGRGSGEQVFSFFSSLKVEASKEIILIIAGRERVDVLFEVVGEVARVNEKGRAIAFTIPIGRLAGLNLDDGEKGG